MATLKFRCTRLAESEEGDSFTRELYFTSVDKQGQPLVPNIKGGSLQVIVSGSDDYFKDAHVGSVITLENSGAIEPAKAPAAAPAPSTDPATTNQPA